MDIQPIRTEQDYEQALGRIEALMDAEPGTAEGDLLEMLVVLAENYESKHFAIDEPDPIEFIRNAMEFRCAGQNDLAVVLGSRPRASEILNRKRPLTLDQIRRITRAWQVPADPLVREYEVG